MADDVLGLLGLARRAGKLAIGDEPVAELIATNRARCVFLAADAGSNIVRKLQRMTEEKNLPLFSLEADKAALGGALGRASCAVCATDDAGFAASAASKLARDNAQVQPQADALAQKQARILRRRGKHKPKSSKTEIEITDIDEEKYLRRFGKADSGKSHE